MRRTDYWFVLNTMYSRKIPERRYEIPEEFAGRLWSKVTRKAQSFSQASFICAGALAFSLGALSWNYGTYTWQTNCDTFNKISFDGLPARRDWSQRRQQPVTGYGFLIARGRASRPVT